MESGRRRYSITGLRVRRLQFVHCNMQHMQSFNELFGWHTSEGCYLYLQSQLHAIIFLVLLATIKGIQEGGLPVSETMNSWLWIDNKLNIWLCPRWRLLPEGVGGKHWAGQSWPGSLHGNLCKVFIFLETWQIFLKKVCYLNFLYLTFPPLADTRQTTMGRRSTGGRAGKHCTSISSPGGQREREKIKLILREGCKKKKARFHSLLLWRGPAPPPPLHSHVG